MLIFSGLSRAATPVPGLVTLNDRIRGRDRRMPSGRQRAWHIVWTTLAAGLILFAPISAALAQDSNAAAPKSERSDESAVRTPGASGSAASAADLSRFSTSIVKLDTQVPDDATSTESLGKRRSGSGVIVGNQLVLTVGYLLLEADQVMVTTADGKRLPGNVAGYDHSTGFGLVRTAFPMSGQVLELGDSDSIGERSRVLTQGQGELQATELLVVSRKPFTGSWEYMIDKPFYTFPPVNNWSGSALITVDGKLIGIGSLIVNDAATAQKGVPGNLFVPVNLLKPIYADLISRGRRSSAVQPWLGMSTEEVRGNLLVVRVAKDGPAEAAGITPGDIVVGVGSDKIHGQSEFYKRLWASGAAGTVVPLQIFKDGEIRQVPVTSMDRTDSLRKPSGI